MDIVQVRMTGAHAAEVSHLLLGECWVTGKPHHSPPESAESALLSSSGRHAVTCPIHRAAAPCNLHGEPPQAGHFVVI